MTDARVRIVLIDDVPELRNLMRLGIEEDPTMIIVGDAGEAESGITLVAELRPDAVLLDLSMPGMDGLEAIPLIAAASPDSAIVVFSGFAADRMAALALEVGADHYLEKGSPLDDIRDAIVNAIVQRRSPTSSP